MVMQPLAIAAIAAAPRIAPSNYPAELVARMAGREKRALGDLFGLTNFGVNLTRLAPGAASAFLHSHSRQDEFVFILEGRATLKSELGEMSLGPGMCAGFAAGGPAHQFVNETSSDVVLLEIGDRSAGDEVRYPADDLMSFTDASGRRFFTRKDGSNFDQMETTD
jgi:uncharacterized cupin superfamily protein